MPVQTSERRDVCGVRTGPKVPRAQIALTSFNVTCGSAPLRNFLNLERREICLSMRRKQSPAHARTNSMGSFHATAVYPHQHGQHCAQWNSSGCRQLIPGLLSYRFVYIYKYVRLPAICREQNAELLMRETKTENLA